MLLEKPWPRGALEEEVKWKNGKERKVKEAYALLKGVVRWALLEVFSPEWCHGGQHRINHSLSPTLCLPSLWLGEYLTLCVSFLLLSPSSSPFLIRRWFQPIQLIKLLVIFVAVEILKTVTFCGKIVIYNGCPPPHTHTHTSTLTTWLNPLYSSSLSLSSSGILACVMYVCITQSKMSVWWMHPFISFSLS